MACRACLQDLPAWYQTRMTRLPTFVTCNTKWPSASVVFPSWSLQVLFRPALRYRIRQTPDSSCALEVTNKRRTPIRGHGLDEGARAPTKSSFDLRPRDLDFFQQTKWRPARRDRISRAFLAGAPSTGERQGTHHPSMKKCPAARWHIVLHLSRRSSRPRRPTSHLPTAPRPLPAPRRMRMIALLQLRGGVRV